ncbi:MAG TPA: HNH/ENDO VII family nuclease [Pyrinomonadaceae bacterium]|nr:HNH/ENDO VII family nuclease [Pyrinomonadaceae bacterium]
MRLNREMNILLQNSRGVVTQTLWVIAALVILGVVPMTGLGQEKNPQRGFQPGNAYSISDIESISNTNGNLILNFPLGNLPPGRGGVSGGLSLRYNSKLFDTDVAEIVDNTGQLSLQTHLIRSQNAGWDFVNPLSYRVEFISRLNVEGPQVCDPVNGGLNNARCVYIWKVRVVYPDGAEREFRPVGQNDLLGDGYFNVNPNTLTSPLSYISSDGTYTRLVITRGTGWTLSFPDGSRVVSNGSGGHNTSASFFYDRNNNFMTNGSVTLPTGEITGGLVDQFGRYVASIRNTETREDYIYSLGFNNQSLKWTVKWKTIYILRAYRTTAVTDGKGRGNTSDQTYIDDLDVVESITLPAQLGSLRYQFSYNAPDWVPGTPEPTTPSVGWGEVSGITLPSGASASYRYAQDSTLRPSVRFVLDNQVTRKTLTYQAEYDGTSTPVTEIWGYGVTGLHTSSTITGPDGGVTQFFFKDTTLAAPTAGQVYKEIYPNGEVLERNWQANQPPAAIASSGSGATFMNYFVKTEFRSIPDAAGNLAWTAIKDYSYDKNGNVTRVAEYDWVPYTSYVNAGGIPAGSTPTRVTVTTYHNATPDATNNTTDTGAAYWYTNAPSLRTASASNEIQTGTGQRLTRTEFTYDDPFTTGNLTKQTSWDSSKGVYTNPLLTSNSISVSTQYNQYGMPTLITDARQVQTEYIYGTVSGNVFDLYPTEIKTAFGTSVQRKETRTYDFNTGLVTQVTDTDNSVSTITSYDVIGRPILVRTAADLPEETRTSTQYFDSQRRVVVRSDLNAVGDGKLVSIQHYDQLGRIRLTRQLEEFTNEDVFQDETIGIKVQTRYRFNNPCQPNNTAQCLSDNNAVIGNYVLTSNAYRAATSTAANAESTMGWSRSRSDRTGRIVEAQTFSGGSLPAPWGTNTATTGTVTTAYDAMFTSVTDQAGKIRRSKVDALDRLVRVDEPDAANSLGSQSAPVQATSYQYDSLGNLAFISQGSQTRSFSFTSLSRLREATNPESGTINYEYDENGNLKTKLIARLLPNTSTRITTSYVYDELNRVTSRTYNDGTPNVTYTYDAPGVLNSRGRLTSITSSVSSYSYGEYDAQGRVKRGTQTTAGQDFLMTYQYDVAGRLISQTYPSGRVVKTEYDDAGRIAGVKNNASGTFYAGATSTDATNRFQYSAAGAIQALKLGNGLWEHTNFNSRLQPTQIGLGSASTNSTILQVDYDYGTTSNNGSLQSQTIIVPTVAGVTGFTATQTYTYDTLNRLATAQENNGSSWKQNFDYDRYGNRKLLSGTTLPAALTPSNNPIINPNNNRIDVAATGQTNVSYDDAGNLTREFGGHTYQYDAENKMVSYDGGATGSGGASYSYDGNGNRVQKVVGGSAPLTTIFVYDIIDSQLIAEYSDSGSTTNGTSYVTSDVLGSPRVITGSAQEIKGRHDYLPFGEELVAGNGGRTPQQNYGADNLRKKFTQKERDIETGLDYFLARYYSSAQGRFTSPDEFTGGPDEFYDFKDLAAENPTFYADLTDPQSLHKYQYGYNNPLLYVDPDGHQGVREWFKNKAKAAGRAIAETVEGAASAYAEDNGLGGTTGSQNKVGRAIGHGLALVQGAGEVYAGVSAAIGGGGEAVVTSPACATVVGCAAPAAGVVTAVAGVAVAAHGTLVVGNTLNNIFSKKKSAYENTPENRERMQQGRPPVGKDGNPVELHHKGQKPNGKIQELTREQHRGPGNHGKNHPNRGPSKVDHGASWRKFRERYWKKKVE